MDLYNVSSTLWLCLLVAGGMCCVHLSGYLITSLVPLISTPWKREDMVTLKSSVELLDNLIRCGKPVKTMYLLRAEAVTIKRSDGSRGF